MIVEVALTYYGYHYRTIVRSHNTHSAGRIALMFLPDWVDPLQVTIKAMYSHSRFSTPILRNERQKTNRQPAHCS